MQSNEDIDYIRLYLCFNNISGKYTGKINKLGIGFIEMLAISINVNYP